jgi:fructan beta-fructosidase
MKNTFFLLLLSYFSMAQRSQNDTTYRQRYRPQFHFSPKKNWTNDPNGLVYFAGEYHLFYQHNPFGDRWGHMTWGHAVSKDLVKWTELPPAIAEENGVMIFSGCVVIDSLNSSGFGKNAMVAIYTGHEEGKRQTQHLAYSTDRGRTWTKYAQNPILNYTPEQRDFRDPNVIWYAPLQVWLMTVVLPNEQKALFYHSKNLTNWTQAGEFQMKNTALGIWECPALIDFDTPEGKKWLLLISVGKGAVAGGSGMQYFVGDFDGKNFIPQDTQTRWVDYGKDFYAAIPFNNTSQKIILGWMNNWQYANNIPTSPFRGQMTLPREISLVKKEGKFSLKQQPLKNHYEGALPTFFGNAKTLNNSFKSTKSTDNFGLNIKAEARDFLVKLKATDKSYTLVGYNAAQKELYIDRTQSGLTGFSKDFPARTTAPLLPDANGLIHLRILVDRCSIEVFGNDGEATMTNLIFPLDNSGGIRFEGDGLKEVQWYKPQNAW